MSRGYWLVKQEPTEFGWPEFLREGGAAWTGVRNFAARLHLRRMRRGDLVGLYHSGEEKQVVGIAKVSREAYPDPTAEEGDWSCVDLVPVKTLKRPVTLADFRSDPMLRETALLRQPRLSVTPLTAAQFSRLLAVSEVSSTPLALRAEHIGLAAQDPVRLKDWYVGVLGARVLWADDRQPPAYLLDLGQGWWLEVYAADRTREQACDNRRAGWRHLALRVDAIEPAREALSARGVTFEEPIKPAGGGGRVLFFRDVEGNLLHLVERPADSPLRRSGAAA